jgi:hypothetical protein
MIAATVLTVEGAYYLINTFGPEYKNDPIIKAVNLAVLNSNSSHTII